MLRRRPGCESILGYPKGDRRPGGDLRHANLVPQLGPAHRVMPVQVSALRQGGHVRSVRECPLSRAGAPV